MGEKGETLDDIIGACHREPLMSAHRLPAGVIPGIFYIPVDKFESLVVSLDMLFQPIDDRSIDFDSGVGGKRQAAIDQCLGKPNTTAYIQQVKTSQICAAYPSGGLLEERFSCCLYTIHQHIRRIALELRRHCDGL